MAAPERIPEFDLYAELGVEPGADAAAVERAWRARVREAHPDRASDEAMATKRTARLNLAREWLLDPSRRLRYDELRQPGVLPGVEMPPIDPLGAWPERRRRPRPPASLAPVVASGSLCVLLTMLMVGVANSVVTLAVTALALTLLVFYGLLALLGSAR